MDVLSRTFAQFRPDDLFPLWSSVDTMEWMGGILPEDAVRWKHGIFGLMVLWGVTPTRLRSDDGCRSAYLRTILSHCGLSSS